MLPKQDFRQALDDTLQSKLTLNHPIFETLFDPANPDLETLRKVALQGYQLTKNFLEYIETLFYFCPKDRKHKRRLLFNLFEEETGRVSKTKNHVELMEDFLRAIGIDDERRDAVLALPQTQELIDYRMKACKDPETYHIGAAAVMVASEGQNLETRGAEARDVLFKKVYGLKDEDLLFFSVHQEEDVHHVRHGLDLVTDVCTTEQMQQEALHAVAHTCDLFYGMYEGIHQELLAGRL
ncbi:iron-containing redox enzyme family protein [Streptomyces sp. P17]|uniref:TenA family transcriptional regulator n=1 Tax=Streptomyces sp. P17 TaxID=3074716 RepID=UPI0028F45245|nr:iron-containing redox enzyme family protein [Streptomyces sp. P17]MDT9698132.1 iron-containing redox enzyme family protein [Streptomyces sp. P17]